jgi:restriction endonuclease S subunit
MAKTDQAKTMNSLRVNPDWVKLPLFDRKGWKRLPFGAFAESVNERAEPSEAAEEIYVGLEHIEPQDLHIRRWGKGSDVIGTKLRFRKGDLIFGRRRAYQRKLAVAEFDGICSAHAMVVRAKRDMVLPEFLPFLMMSDRFMKRAVEISVGSLSPTINWKTLKLEEFAIPPLDQQCRFTDMLWAADDLVTRLTQTALSTDTLLMQYLSSHFKFTGAGGQKTPFGRIRGEWRLSKMEDVGDIQLGQQKHPKYDNGSNIRPYLRVDNVRDGWIDTSNVLKMHFPEGELGKFELRPGDILLNEGQTREYVGRSAIYRGEISGCCFQKTLIRFRCGTNLLPEFAQAYFRFLLRTGFFASNASQTAIAHITAVRFKKMPLAFPSLAGQQEIVAELKRIEEFRKATETHLTESRILHQQLTNTLT